MLSSYLTAVLMGIQSQTYIASHFYEAHGKREDFFGRLSMWRAFVVVRESELFFVFRCLQVRSCCVVYCF